MQKALTWGFFFSALTIAISGCFGGNINIVEAVEDNQAGTVRRWISDGGNPNLVDSVSGKSLLFLATGPNGGIEVLDVLLDGGANPNFPVSGDTPLMNASMWVNSRAVRRLLAKGADPNAKSKDGKRAIDLVGEGSGRNEVIQMLNKK